MFSQVWLTFAPNEHSVVNKFKSNDIYRILAYCRMKSVIHDELASGTFLQAKAQALSTKSFTDSLYAPSESRFNCFRTLNDKTDAERSYNMRYQRMLTDQLQQTCLLNNFTQELFKETI